MTTARIKRGQALQLTLAFANADGSAFDLTTVTIWGEVRDPRGALIAQLALIPSGTPGVATIAVANTGAWPVGLLAADLMILNAGMPTPTESFGIEVRQAITSTTAPGVSFDPVTDEGEATSIVAAPPTPTTGGSPVVLPAQVTITQFGLSPAVVLADGPIEAPPFTGIKSVTYATPLTLDLVDFRNFMVTLTGPLTLANPVNAAPCLGEGVIILVQDSEGSRMLSAAGSAWLFAGGTLPVLSTEPGAIDVLFYRAISPSQILVVPRIGFAAT